MKVKYFILFFIFLFLFFIQAGVIYIIVYQPNLLIVVDSFLASLLIMCFSFGFILVYVGLTTTRLMIDERLILRFFGILLVLISFGCMMLIMIEMR